MGEFRTLLREKMALLKLDDTFAGRYVNEGFSGGEKKRLEMLQMAVLQPEIAILDETDSGLDIDALRIVAEGVNAQLSPDLGVLLITHYQRILNYIKPDHGPRPGPGAHRRVGRAELALRLEEEGYAPVLREAGFEVDAETRPRPSHADEPDALSRTMHEGDGRRVTSPTHFDPEAIRRDFPHLRARLQRPPLAYLDSAATARSSRASWLDAVDGYTRRYSANVHRGIYTIGEEATAAYEDARVAVATFINAPDAREVVFVRNATEAINLVAYAWGRQQHRPRPTRSC